MNKKNSQSRGLLHKYFVFLNRRGPSDKIFLQLSLALVLTSAVFFGITLNNTYLTSIPSTGGTLVEGIIGTPRFVNPVLATTRADRDVAALIYSGLMKQSNDGSLVPDVAKSISVSDDGRTYNVKLQENVFFHNGAQLTVKDVAYTIALIQNSELKSPLRGNWEGVLIEELGDFEMNIIIKEKYAPFIENLNVGILPRSIWDELPTEQLPFSQNNTQPIGSGPYKVEDVLRNKSGLISSYKLISADNYNKPPNITTVVFNFYQNEEAILMALENNEIAGTAGLSNKSLSTISNDAYTIIEQPLPRTFAIYFNQNKSIVLRDIRVREALNIIIDKEALVQEILFGYGIPANSPIPAGFIATDTQTNKQTYDGQNRTEEAKTLLLEAGWSQNETGGWEKEIDNNVVPLSISITTSNTPLFDQTAQYVASAWEALGIQVTVAQFEQSDLVQSIIRPRNFEALLFGADIGRHIDLYPFWHSSQKDDPGLNIAQYTNIDADALLEDIRTETDEPKRTESILKLTKILTDDSPALFLFTPTFGYLLDKDVDIEPLQKINTQSDRFANIAEWHIESNKVWPIFSNN